VLHLPAGSTDVLYSAPLHDGDPASPLTGLATVVVKIWRASDGYFYDFNDDTFKASGHTSITASMTQFDATNAPGVYYYVFDTSAITNAVASGDVYHYQIDETGGSAKNVPQDAEVLVGDWVDHLDADISSRAAPGDAMDLVTDAVDSAAVATSGVNEIRDAILSDSTPFDGADVAAILADTAAIDARLPSDPADESNQLAQHAATQAAVAALNDLSSAGVQAAMTAQGYTAARAPNLDNLDQQLSTTESNIRGVDSDDLKNLSDQIDDVQGRLPAALVGGRIDADVGAVQASVIDAAAIATGAIDADALATDAIAEIATYLETGGPNPHGTGAWDAVGAGLTQQQVRDALKLAPTGGAPAGGSVDEALDEIYADTAAIDARLPSDPADESNQLAAHAATQAAVAALNDLSQIEAQAAAAAALIAQGYTTVRAAHLDADISSRAAPGDAMTLTAPERAAVDAQLSGTHGSGSWEPGPSSADWSAAEKNAIREALGVPGSKAGATGGQLQDVLTDTAAVDARLPSDPADESSQTAQHATTQAAIAALEDLSQGDVQAAAVAALTAQGYTSVRADLLDNLDAAISAVIVAIGALNDMDQADVQTALTAQGYTVTRAAMIELIKKVLINRLELADGGSGNMVLYDDDDSTPLLTFAVTDHNGNAIVLANQEPARRGRGT